MHRSELRRARRRSQPAAPYRTDALHEAVYRSRWPLPAAYRHSKSFVDDDAADWEAEVAVIISKPCKDVTETEAMEYVLGITAANDVSSRKAQFAQSQWCYSKGFDGACPIGPAVVPLSQIADLGEVKVQAKLNDTVVQESDLRDLIFSIPKIVSFLSKGTTLLPGTLILTGTPAGSDGRLARVGRSSTATCLPSPSRTA